MKTATQNRNDNLEIDAEYVFELLFEFWRKLPSNDTKGNLKLVHIVCHNKNPHKLECDKSKLFLDPVKPSPKKIKLGKDCRDASDLFQERL